MTLVTTSKTSKKYSITQFTLAEIPSVITELQALLAANAPVATPTPSPAPLPPAPQPSPVPMPPAPAPDPVLPDGATVVFHEDWLTTDRILTPAERDNKRGGRWSDGSNAPNGVLTIVPLPDGSRELDAAVLDALNHNDGGRASMTIDTPQWNDLPEREGQTGYWLIRARLKDMPTVLTGAGKWFSIAQLKRKDSEVPAYTEINVRGDRGFNELYLVMGGQSFYFPTPTPLVSNEPFVFLLEAKLSRDPAVGLARLHFRGEVVSAAGATLNPADGGGVFMLTAYGNNAPTLRVGFAEVTFATSK